MELLSTEFDGRGARRGAVNRFGSLLLLWAACAEAAPPVADVLALDHLAWADEPLSRLGRGAGFYASLARATRELVATIAATRLTG